jgi:hypothetical protein
VLASYGLFGFWKEDVEVNFVSCTTVYLEGLGKPCDETYAVSFVMFVFCP